MRRGARVTALDYSAADLKDVAAVAGAMLEAGEVDRRRSGPASSTATRSTCRSPTTAFDRVDRVRGARAHLGRRARARRDRPRAAARRPASRRRCRRAGPSASRGRSTDRYHDTPGGHVRIYRQHELEQKLERAGLLPARLAPRARVPLAVLVAEVRVRARQHRSRAGEALPRLPLPPHRAQPALGARHRTGAQPGARQEPRRSTARRSRRRWRKWGKRSLG